MNRNNVLIRCLLSPFAMLYGTAMGIRNRLFDYKILPSTKFSIPVICIGNLTAGGTGKTPFAEYLVALLKQQYRVAVLSRGYKRATTGFVLAGSDCTAMDVGDEPCQIKRKFPDVIVAVDANRRRGIKRLMELPDAKPDVILLDDGMQHRYVSPSLSIMLTACDNLYYSDYLLPVGNLREPSREANRADIVIVTKCQQVLKPIDLRIIEKNMSLMANQSLYFSRIKYNGVEAIFPEAAPRLAAGLDEFIAGKEVLLIAGIANPQLFIDRIKACAGENVRNCIFPDHHAFTPDDIAQIDALFQQMSPEKRMIICTEKDAVRLKTLGALPDAWKRRLYCVPISMEFLFDRSENLDTRILKHVLSTININKKDGKN